VGNRSHLFFGLIMTNELKQQIFSNLTKETVGCYAAHVYNNPNFTNENQFYRDMRRLSSIKKQMNRFDMAFDKEDHERITSIIINNIVIFFNMFGVESGLRVLFTLTENRYYCKLRPILELLFPEQEPLIIEGVNNLNIIVEQIETDDFFASFVNTKTEYYNLYGKHRKD
jgi:hypothetical protein